MCTTTLYLVRHAEAQGNQELLFQGHTDGGLSENGRCQLDRLAWRFKDVKISNIYTSPLRRAVETAKAINRHADLPLILDGELSEINGGAFEGLPFDELPERFPDAFRRWARRPSDFVAPGGESMRQVFDRMQQVLNRIVHANMGAAVVVVSHGCAIRNYLCHITDTPFDQLSQVQWCENTGVSRIEFDNKWAAKVRYINDATHLPEALSTLSRQDWWKTDEQTDNDELAREVLARG